MNVEEQTEDVASGTAPIDKSIMAREFGHLGIYISSAASGLGCPIMQIDEKA